MIHEYQISGMTCDSCVATVKSVIEAIPGIRSAKVQLNSPQATLEMDKHVSTAALQEALKGHPKYKIQDYHAPVATFHQEEDEDQRGFWEIYKPIILVFAFIWGVTGLIEISSGIFDLMRWMRHFMAGFFLVFSFFKLLDLRAFADSYSSYDVIAKRWLGWGYLYPFIELTLGILFLMNYQMLITNVATLMVMGVSSIGVFQSLIANRKIKCACLGAVFNLPMSTITLIEDLLMVLMAGAMIISYI